MKLRSSVASGVILLRSLSPTSSTQVGPFAGTTGGIIHYSSRRSCKRSNKVRKGLTLITHYMRHLDRSSSQEASLRVNSGNSGQFRLSLPLASVC